MKNAWLESAAALLLAGMMIECGRETAPARAPGGPAPVASAPSVGPRKAPEMAPTPYTAEQIRAANRPGTVYRYKIEAAGEPTVIKVMEFTSGSSAESAEVKDESLDQGGKPMAPATVEHTPWEDLRRHGEFPRAALTVAPGSIEVPAGQFEVMVYTVTAPNGEVGKFYFAKSYAGPPVMLCKERAGTRLMTMTLIERKSGG